MNNNQNIPGFTILEMVLALMLSVLVVALAYQSFSYILTEWKVYDSNNRRNIALLLFKNTIEEDIERSSCITKLDKTFYFNQKDDTIMYVFDDMIVRRNKYRRDTFTIHTGNTISENILLPNGTTVINKIGLDIDSPFFIKNVKFQKYYTCEELVTIQTGE